MRSGGDIAAARGAEVPLARLRDRLGAETVADLEVIAAGSGAPKTALATAPVPAPHAGARGALVVCGFYVSLTTRQLGHLCRTLDVELIGLDILALIGGDGDAEVRRVASQARKAIERGDLAVVATPRERPEWATSLAAGARVADHLARVVAAIRPLPDVVVAKGGITSQVVLERGLGESEATVVGPVAAGVAQWRVAAADHDAPFHVTLYVTHSLLSVGRWQQRPDDGLTPVACRFQFLAGQECPGHVEGPQSLVAVARCG